MLNAEDFSNLMGEVMTAQTLGSYHLHVAELRGFLNASQQMCGGPNSFYVDLFDVPEDIQSAVEHYFETLDCGFLLRSIQTTSYNDIKMILNERIFLKLNSFVTIDVKRNLLWHLVEYYGLVSTAIDQDGVFNPLVTGPVYRVDFQSADYLSKDCYVVLVGSLAIVTTLGDRKI